jgi:hypothetical protein
MMSVRVDRTGAVVVYGSFGGVLHVGAASHASSSPVGQIFVAMLDPKAMLAPVWSAAWSPNGFVLPAPFLDFDPSDDLVLAGGFRGTLDFGCGPIAANASTPSDVFVAKLTP